MLLKPGRGQVTRTLELVGSKEDSCTYGEGWNWAPQKNAPYTNPETFMQLNRLDVKLAG